MFADDKYWFVWKKKIGVFDCQATKMLTFILIFEWKIVILYGRRNFIIYSTVQYFLLLHGRRINRAVFSTPWPLECEFFAIISLTVAFIKILRTRYEVQLWISHLLARSIGYVNLWPLLSKHEIFLEAKNTIFQRSYRLCFFNSSCIFAHGDSLTPKVIHIWWREKNH